MSSLFGQPSGGSLFGQSSQQQQISNPFGATNLNQNKPNLFGSINANTANSQSQQGGGLFGSMSQPAQTGGLFGTSQPAQTGGLFGSSQPQQQGGLFGSTQAQQPQPQQQQQQSGSIFGLGTTNNQQSQQQQPQQPLGGGSLFGNFGQTAQQPQQGQQQGSVLGQTQNQSRLFQQSELPPRQRSVTDQIELAFAKWNPASPQTLFQTYLYNWVPPETAPFYGPTPQDDEAKWEEALSKKPSSGAIPVLVRGFEQIAVRMKQQFDTLNTLRGRLHEINDGLNMLLQKHDLQISIRAAECRRKHVRLSHQCLSLAAKTQVLKNRGYAMDSVEEALRQKLLTLERSIFDPALNGRSEEIWARMVSVRERGRQLQREFEVAGRGIGQDNGGVIDEEVMKRARKILEDYNSQLSHLANELAQIQKDWAEWERSKPLAVTNGGR